MSRTRTLMIVEIEWPTIIFLARSCDRNERPKKIAVWFGRFASCSGRDYFYSFA
jgi:hypothetical protein